MFSFDQLNQIHLEITNNCQASCPMCTRNINGGLENPLIKTENWSIERYKSIISEEVIQQVSMIYFCGNYGDPLLNNDLLSMIDYTVGMKEDICIRIHTNGSLRSKHWWKKLAQSLPVNHSVIFALDGLEDTHSLYRIGTDFDKIIENAQCFILEGGRAEWTYLRFKHNEHQVEKARSMAVQLGFETFVMKDSSRWMLDTKFPVYDNNKDVTHYLEPSQWSQLKFIDKKVLDNYKKIIKDTEIGCFALRTKEIYITAQGLLFPCCWLGMIPYLPINHEHKLVSIRKEILRQYYQLVDSLGGHNAIDAEKRSIKEIINSQEYQTVWDNYWHDDKLITCVRSCGKNSDIMSTPRDQFTKTNKLKNENQ